MIVIHCKYFLVVRQSDRSVGSCAVWDPLTTSSPGARVVYKQA